MCERGAGLGRRGSCQRGQLPAVMGELISRETAVEKGEGGRQEEEEEEVTAVEEEGEEEDEGGREEGKFLKMKGTPIHTR